MFILVFIHIDGHRVWIWQSPQGFWKGFYFFTKRRHCCCWVDCVALLNEIFNWLTKVISAEQIRSGDGFSFFNTFLKLDWIHEKVGSLCYDNQQSCFRDPEYAIRCGRRGCFPINTNVNTEPTFVNFLWRSFDFSLELQLLIWLIWWKFINHYHSTKRTTPADVFFGLRFRQFYFTDKLMYFSSHNSSVNNTGAH